MAMNKTFVNFALLGLFVLAFISFNVTVQENNDVTDTIRSNSVINSTYVDLDSELGQYQAKGQNQSENQDDENPLAQDGSLIFFTIKNTGSVIKGMVNGVYNVIIVIPGQILGFPELVMGVMTAILMILLTLAAWRLYKAGE